MIYWDLIRFSFLRFFAYPYEIIAQAAKRAIEVVFLIIFWTIYSKSTNQNISVSQISSYFLVAMGIADLTMARWGAYSNLIGNLARSGQLSNYIIKPANLVWSLYALALGRNGLRLFLALVVIILGIIINPPKTAVSILIFVVFFLLSWSISFSYNLFEGSLFLHFADASGIRNALENIMRVFTGVMIPLYIFPSPLKEIIRLSPFPYMVYTPTYALTLNSLDTEVDLNIILAVFWAIALHLLTRKWWHYSMKKYEAVGI